MLARVGQLAPEFTVDAYHDGEFKTISLKDLRGKWVVLFFYPGDYTFVCPTELTTLAARYSELANLNTEVLSFSTDSKFVHMSWVRDELSKMVETIPYPMCTDKSGTVGTAYGVFDEESGTDVRGWFLIDPDGVLQSMEILNPAVGRNIDEIIRQVKAYQYVREHNQEVLPCGWQPGESTLQPGEKLTGQVWKEWRPKAG